MAGSLLSSLENMTSKRQVSKADDMSNATMFGLLSLVIGGVASGRVCACSLGSRLVCYAIYFY